MHFSGDYFPGVNYRLRMDRIKIGISSCLLGRQVRYDGGHKFDPYIADTLGPYFEWIPICPEVECGLPVPREPMHLVGDPLSPRLVTVDTHIDFTEDMIQWTIGKFKDLEREGLCGFIFKSKSPSSAIGGVRVHTPPGTSGRKGSGIFGSAFMKRFPLIPVIDSDKLHDRRARENFMRKVITYKINRSLKHAGFQRPP
jgi:uncharacterized protein YbbK (DUF523 family)